MAARRNLPPVPQADNVNVDILLPTGMLVTLTCHNLASLADIKASVWQEARNLPFFDMMKDQGFYSFFGE